MTGASAVDLLVARGLDRGEIAAKTALFDLVLTEVRPDVLAWVPGRLEVFGKHTDYAGGRTLVCAVPRGFAMGARARADGRLHVTDARRGQSLLLDLSGPAAVEAGWRNYVAVVARRLARNFPGARIGADLVFASDLPSAAGMSSSSALVVAVATALARLAGLESRPEWRSNVRTDLDRAGYFACLENGMTFGALEGDRGVGTHGGSEDHAAILTGRPQHVSAFAFVPMRRLGDAAVPRDWRFVLAPSGVKASKTGAAMHAYNRLSYGARVLTTLANEGSSHERSLAAALADGTTAIDRLRHQIRKSEIEGWSASALADRLDHFLREDVRIARAFDAFRDADRHALGQLASESQADAERLLGNQVPETVGLARSATSLGAFAASSFGAGFGGSVWALVDADAAADFASRWEPQAFPAVPGPPVTEVFPRAP
jgi:galactokinase